MHKESIQKFIIQKYKSKYLPLRWVKASKLEKDMNDKNLSAQRNRKTGYVFNN
jgi:hypothetical protein